MFRARLILFFGKAPPAALIFLDISDLPFSILLRTQSSINPNQHVRNKCQLQFPNLPNSTLAVWFQRAQTWPFENLLEKLLRNCSWTRTNHDSLTSDMVPHL